MVTRLTEVSVALKLVGLIERGTYQNSGLTFFNRSGVGATADPLNYFITLPSWSTSTYAAGSIISYYHEENQYKDKLILPGPTSEELNIYVS